MYNHTYSYNVNPQKRRFCSDAQGTPITELPTFYFGERPVFTMTFPDNVLTEGEKLVFVMDNENRFLDSHSITGLEPVMAWCIHEITAEDVTNKSIDLELYCFSRKYADVINGHDNSVTCILSLFIKSIDENLNCTFSTLATTLAYAEPTIVSPDCVFDELPIDMYLTRDEMNALIAEVEAIQREAIEKAEQARQSAAIAEAAAQEASQIAKDLKPIILSSPPTTSTVGSVGQLAVWHDGENNKDHLYHLCHISTSESATLYHWEECVLVSQGNVAGGYAALDENALIPPNELPTATSSQQGAVKTNVTYGTDIRVGYVAIYAALNNSIDIRNSSSAVRLTYQPIVPKTLDYAVRSVLPNVTEIPAATSDYSLVDSSATTLNHSHTFVHTPSQAPTYRLPSVSDTTISHYIELTVDFTNVQTYSFLDANGDALVPLFTPSIAVGDVYTFRMEYSAIKAKWLIYPQKQGAVADDFVMRGEVGVANGVASLNANKKIPPSQIPLAIADSGRPSSAGGIRIDNRFAGWGYNGVYTDSSGFLYIGVATSTQINNRTPNNSPSLTAGHEGYLTPAIINYAVKASITDSKHFTLTDAQKATAQSVFGVGGAVTSIPAATSQYTLSYGRFSHVPELASTYVLPAVADGSIANDIMLSIKFSSIVLTYEFQDSAGNTLVPLTLNGDIEDGSVVTFLCRYNPLLSQWVIYPVMDGKEAQE